MASAIAFSTPVSTASVAKANGVRRSAAFGTPVKGLGAKSLAVQRRAGPIKAAWSADEKPQGMKEIAQKFAAGGLAALMALAPMAELPAMANEFDIINYPTPSGKGYILDDAGVLSKSATRGLNTDLATLELQTGYKVIVITTRKLEFTSDPFEFADQVIEKWYPTVELGDDKAILLLVTGSKEGALTGGPSAMKAFGDELIDSVVGDNIPILINEGKFNEATTSSVKRIIAVLNGQPDPGPPIRSDNERKRTYKTKEETSEKKDITSTIVIALLVISFVVPMLQYYAYTARD